MDDMHGNGYLSETEPYRSYFSVVQESVDIMLEYYEGMHYRQDNDKVALENFYITSKYYNTLSHIYMNFKIEGSTSTDDIPSG